MNLLAIQAPVRRKPLLLYLASSPSAIGALIAQEDGGNADLLHKPRPKGCGDPLSQSKKGMPNNSLCIAKTMSLFLGLRDTLNDKIPRD